MLLAGDALDVAHGVRLGQLEQPIEVERRSQIGRQRVLEHGVARWIGHDFQPPRLSLEPHLASEPPAATYRAAIAALHVAKLGLRRQVAEPRDRATWPRRVRAHPPVFKVAGRDRLRLSRKLNGGVRHGVQIVPYVQCDVLPTAMTSTFE